MLYRLGGMLKKISTFNSRMQAHYERHVYRKQLKYLGEGVRFNGNSTITGLENISIQQNVHLGNGAYIRGEGGLYIGDNTHISRNLIVYTHNHNYKGKCLPYDDSFIYKPVHIGKNVWIGINVVILPGAEIGDGAIIGAGSVVSGKVEPGAIVVHPRQVHLKNRDAQHYEALEQAKSYGGINGTPLS